jgi:ribonuclease G
MTQDILLDVGPDMIRLAVLEDGKPVAFDVERDPVQGQMGSIYRGRVTQVLPGMQAAFVDLGKAGAGFLHARDAYPIPYDANGEPLPVKGAPPRIEQSVRAGQELTVQIVREANGDKGPRLTTRWTLPGHAVMLLPGSQSIGVSRRIRNPERRAAFYLLARKHRPDTSGLVIRTAAESVTPESIVREIDRLEAVRRKVEVAERKGEVPRMLHAENGLFDKVVREYRHAGIRQVTVNHTAWYERLRDAFAAVDPSWGPKVRLHTGTFGLFELHGVDAELRRALSRKVWLKSGGWLLFDRTEAMTVVDVNSGKFTGKKDFQATAEAVNLEAVNTLVRQVRLRNLGGIIVVDFIDMASPESRSRLVETLRETFAACDGTRTTVAGMTQLGLVEISRRRIGQPLSILLWDQARELARQPESDLAPPYGPDLASPCGSEQATPCGLEQAPPCGSEQAIPCGLEQAPPCGPEAAVDADVPAPVSDSPR